MPLKKPAAPTSILAPIDQNMDEEARLVEAWREKRKDMDPPPQDDLDKEIKNLKAMHQQVEKQREMNWVSQLQRQIDEESEELCHITKQH